MGTHIPVVRVSQPCLCWCARSTTVPGSTKKAACFSPGRVGAFPYTYLQHGDGILFWGKGNVSSNTRSKKPRGTHTPLAAYTAALSCWNRPTFNAHWMFFYPPTSERTLTPAPPPSLARTGLLLHMWGACAHITSPSGYRWPPVASRPRLGSYYFCCATSFFIGLSVKVLILASISSELGSS